MRYLIHTCNQRLWYVNDYLISSMIKQGIDRQNIAVYLDKNNDGCLESCMKSFLTVHKKGHTWHLQDDILICDDFKERTEYAYEESIVCGFCYDKDDRKRFVGRVNVKEMWFSFPCIRIENKIARDCAKWYFNYAKTAKEYRVLVNSKKYDDSMFFDYVADNWQTISVLNLKPALVDHVDYLIGGSIVNKIRPEKETHSVYFEDTYLISELEKQLKESKIKH